MKNIFLFFSAAIILAFPSNLKAEKLFNKKTFTLSNGLTVIINENHRAPIVTQMIWYKTGSIDDPLGKTGTAHLLEHLMFKGTKSISSGDFSKIISKNGGKENAFTSYNYTSYFQNIAKDRLELAMFLEADRMGNLNFSEQNFLLEKDVVIEERLLRIDNDPSALLLEQMNKVLWGDHPYSRPIIGTQKDFASISSTDIKDFYKEHYSPDNAILVLSGDITIDEAIPLVEKYYGKIAPSRKPLEKRIFTAPLNLKTEIKMKSPIVKVKSLTKSFITPSFISEDKHLAPAFDILTEILGAEKLGKYYKILIESNLASSYDCTYNGFVEDKGSLNISVIANSDIDLSAINNILEQDIDITKADVKAAKKRLVSGMEYLIDNPETTANLLGKFAILGLSAEYIETYPKMIMDVPYKQVIEAYKLLKNYPMITTYLTPEGIED
ncbi:MAG: insulinase family protein [Alphaproteobacteria bacterium]|nr:insulinase family protein [Alphaproteobacteria bacterium]